MSPLLPTPPSLAALPASAAWSAFPSPTYGHDELAARGCRLAILPIHGFGDHGLGLSLDVEEVIGSALLAASFDALPEPALVRVLPPLRHVLAPYGSPLGGVDPETFHETIREIAAGVKASGFDRLLFFCTSPWNGEIVDAASRDVRVDLNLQTFVIELGGLGLHLHPQSPDRARAQALAANLLGQTPDATATNKPPGGTDTHFRPGNWQHIPPVVPDASIDAPELLGSAAQRLARLLAEIMTRPGLGSTSVTDPIAVRAAPRPSATVPVFPGARRSRYLGSFSDQALQALPQKEAALVILPVGAIEQHGAHLPVGVDAYIGEAACAELAARLPADCPVWFGPSLPLGKSNEHLDYPGTVSLSAKTLRRLLLAQVEALHTLGFRQFALLNTHGGNSAVLVYTLREIQQRFGVRAGMLRVPSSPELSTQEATWGFHAGEWETAVMLALTPTLVDMAKAICHYPASLDDPGDLRPESAPAIFSWMTRDIAPAGVMGDATLATADKGQRWFSTAMDAMVQQIRDLVSSR